MGHNEHFLERTERLDFAQMDRAMSLYRDPAFVRDLLSFLKLPDRQERVALELEHGGNGPYVVVDRRGLLVTCLAVGMAPFDARVVRKDEFDSLLVRAETLRVRQRALAEAIEKEGGANALHERLREGHKVSRETIRALTALTPLQAFTWYLIALQHGRALDLKRRSLLGRHAAQIAGPAGLKAFSMELWTHSNLYALAMSDGVSSMLKTHIPEGLGQGLQSHVIVHMGRAGILGPMMRGIWGLGNIGNEILPDLKQNYRECFDMPTLQIATFALFGAGMRYRRFRGEVRRLLEKGPQFQAPFPADERLALYKTVAQQLAKFLDEPPENAVALVDHFAREYVVEQGERLPEGHPARFETKEAVPADWVPSVIYNLPWLLARHSLGIQLSVLSAAHLATAPLEQLFLPEAAMPLLQDWEPRMGEEQVAGMVSDRAPKQPIKHAEAKLGRNDPCHCGSGEKYKKCHMGRDPAPTD